MVRTRSMSVAPRLVTTAAVGLCVLAASAVASANGRFPEADQLVAAPNHPEQLVLRTTFGLLFSRDAGASWDWVCERAVGYSGTEDPTLGVMADGVVVAGLQAGIARSGDRGCGWSFASAELGGAPVVDLSVRKDSPNQAVALVWDRQAPGSGAAYRSRFLATNDNGLSFSAYGSGIDPSVLVLTLDVAPSDPTRLYASGVRSVAGVRSGFLFVSRDAGETFSEFPVPFDSRVDQGVYIAAVDPLAADTVYLRTSSTALSRLLVTRSAGTDFDVAFSGAPILAFALTPDGSRIYLGGNDGLFSASASELNFEQRATLRLLCLAATNETLYACSDEHSGFTVGASRDGGVSFEPKLHLSTVRGPLACEGGDSTTCREEWPQISTLLGIRAAMSGNAGASGAEGGASGASGAAPAPQIRAAGGSCAFGRDRGAARSLGAALLGLSLAALSRRCRSPARRRLPAR